MSKRSTNFELFRILLTIAIPFYHWMLYNGIFYAENSINNLISLFLLSGVPFTCLYGFITMSSYFLLKKKTTWNAKKLYSFLALAFTLWAFKTVAINCMYPGDKMNYFVDDFFLQGAWWYVYPYILLMIFYPLLNHYIYSTSITKLRIIIAILGIIFIYNIFINHTYIINDCIMFLLIYFIMGYIERKKEFSPKKSHMWIIYTLLVTIGSVFSVYIKFPNNELPLETANYILQKAHGRYNLMGLIGGIIIFILFKDMNIKYRPIIHKISKYTLFVFLLHETVMCVFWVFEIKSCEFLAYMPPIQFWGLLVIYLILCSLFAYIMYELYYRFIDPLWNKLIDKLCATTLSKKWEESYRKLNKEAK